MSKFSLLAFIPLLAVILSAVGIAILALGVRGRPVFSSPRCGKCGYDLRNMQFMSPQSVGNCPECGVALAEPGAVNFGKWQRQPGRILLGVVVLCAPWAAALAVAMYVRSQGIARGGGPQAKAAMTTPALLTSLKTTIDSPWDWQELDRRRTSGTLSQADVDAAFTVLINDLNAKRAAAKPRQPLHWADAFISPAIAAGNASPTQVTALAQSYYGMEPDITMRSRAREADPMIIVVDDQAPWNLAKMKKVWCLTAVVANGTQNLSPLPRYGNQNKPALPDALSGERQMELQLPHALPPGEHEIALTFEVGVVPDTAMMRGLDGKPGTPDKWPSPVARWQSVVRKKITVVPKDQSPITLITDPARDPLKSETITIDQALVRSASDGVQLALKFTSAGSHSPMLSYRVWVQAGEQKIDYGALVIGKTPRGGMHSSPAQKNLKHLPPDVRKIDVVLEPDPRAAEQDALVEEAWGLPHQINDVPLQRFDLQNATPPP